MSAAAEKFDRDLHKLRQNAINLLFDAAGKQTRFIVVYADQDDLSVVLTMDADGRHVPRGDFEPALAAVSAIFGPRHQGLAEYKAPIGAVTEGVLGSIRSDPTLIYGYGIAYTLSRPGALR